jgi:hypothetical protein
MLPSQIGVYEIMHDSMLGQGGFGKVFLARNPHTQGMSRPHVCLGMRKRNVGVDSVGVTQRRLPLNA